MLPDSLEKEIQEKLDLYEQLLRKWQKSLNLVSNASLEDARVRHFEDSMQLAVFIPQQSVLFDIGSGAGFPGLVLAMIRPDLAVTLIESDTKKCTFLSTVSRETVTPVTIINQRLENVSRETIPDIITARALASLDKLLDYCLPWAQENPALTLLFLKGEKAEEEIKLAKIRYEFDVLCFPGKTGDGAVVQINNLSGK